jgi:putative ABC transport system permease protein
MKRAIIGGLIGFVLGWLLQGIGLVKLDAITRALSVGSANFVTIAFAVTIGFAVICGIIGALFLAMGIGIGSGVIPAYRASKLKPVDALRYE